MTNIVFISPHYDDICFSLGGLIQNLRQGTLVTIFTKTGWVTEPETMRAVNHTNRIEAVSQIRDAEEAAFAQKYNLNKTTLGFLDSHLVVSPKAPFEKIDEEIAALQKSLNSVLQNMISEQKTIIMCPLAIGRHRNHLSTFMAVASSMGSFPKHVQTFFYEDLYYSAVPANRQARLSELQDFLTKNGYRRYPKPLTQSEISIKLEDVKNYKSQLLGKPIIIEDYSIVTEDMPERHEAIWSNAEVSL